MSEYGDLIGTICRCKHGILGLVTDWKYVSTEPVYYGFRIKDGGAWQSKNPTVVYNSLEDYILVLTNGKT